MGGWMSGLKAILRIAYGNQKMGTNCVDRPFMMSSSRWSSWAASEDEAGFFNFFTATWNQQDLFKTGFKAVGVQGWELWAAASGVVFCGTQN